MERLAQIDINLYTPTETAIIICGDAGLNFYLNQTDRKNKEAINNTGFRLYCVRGNHEERPQNISSMRLQFDFLVSQFVYIERDFPNIRYLVDGVEYLIDGRGVLILGGAYSVDKEYRLSKFVDKNGWTGWFKEEQLSQKEMGTISKWCSGKEYDTVISHTCPYSWRPTDLFLKSIDQSKVDNSMELWMDNFKDEITWKHWYWGHYHADRDYGDGRKMMYQGIEEF
jgi:3-oxoacid CoA-transferase subunit A